jgi:hypothetical protein
MQAMAFVTNKGFPGDRPAARTASPGGIQAADLSRCPTGGPT